MYFYQDVETEVRKAVNDLYIIIKTPAHLKDVRKRLKTSPGKHKKKRTKNISP